MAGIQIFPYLRPGPERVAVTGWHLRGQGGIVPLDETLPDWDPGTDIHALIAVDLDLEGIRVDCGLPDGAVLRLAATWYSPGSGLRAAGSAVDLNGHEGNQSVMLEMQIQGIMLAGAVRLEAT